MEGALAMIWSVVTVAIALVIGVFLGLMWATTESFRRAEKHITYLEGYDDAKAGKRPRMTDG